MKFPIKTLFAVWLAGVTVLSAQTIVSNAPQRVPAKQIAVSGSNFTILPTTSTTAQVVIDWIDDNWPAFTNAGWTYVNINPSNLQTFINWVDVNWPVIRSNANWTTLPVTITNAQSLANWIDDAVGDIARTNIYTFAGNTTQTLPVILGPYVPTNSITNMIWEASPRKAPVFQAVIDSAQRFSPSNSSYSVVTGMTLWVNTTYNGTSLVALVGATPAYEATGTSEFKIQYPGWYQISVEQHGLTRDQLVQNGYQVDAKLRRNGSANVVNLTTAVEDQLIMVGTTVLNVTNANDSFAVVMKANLSTAVTSIYTSVTGVYLGK